MTSLPDIEGAITQLDALCVEVGLVRTNDLPNARAGHEPPAGATLWQASYANLLLWPCVADCIEDIEAVAQVAEAWFDEVLSQKERERGQLLDGYLVLALSCRPDKDARDDIRRLELSSLICRKHLIWPSEPEDEDYEPGLWRRVADVTVVGLPEVRVKATGDLYFPELDEEAGALLAEINDLGPAALAARDRVQK